MANINAGPFTTRPEIDGTFGVVASTHWIATAVGMGVLERGGNAFDAGIATAFTLQVLEPNSLFTNVKHAETYERILKEAEAGGGGREKEIERARRAWSQGFVAEAIDAFCRTSEVMDVSGRPHKGVLTAHDMAKWLPTIEEPVHLDYGNYRGMKPHAWTQGPVLLQMLALLEGIDLDNTFPSDPDCVH